MSAGRRLARGTGREYPGIELYMSEGDRFVDLVREGIDCVLRVGDLQDSGMVAEKRKRLVWEIERKLAEDDARPIIFYPRAANCWQPQVKGLTIMANSIYNGWRFEDLWLDK